MLGPVTAADAILLSGDLAERTNAADPMECRLVRLAFHYRQRALMAEDALANNAMAMVRPDRRRCDRRKMRQM